jgi:hypothetical protein
LSRLPAGRPATWQGRRAAQATQPGRPDQDVVRPVRAVVPDGRRPRLERRVRVEHRAFGLDLEANQGRCRPGIVDRLGDYSRHDLADMGDPLNGQKGLIPLHRPESDGGQAGGDQVVAVDDADDARSLACRSRVDREQATGRDRAPDEGDMGHTGKRDVNGVTGPTGDAVNRVTHRVGRREA